MTKADSPPNLTLAFIALLVGNAALASGPHFVRLADTGPVAAAFWRLALALPLLWFFAWRQSARDAMPLLPRGWALVLALAGGLFFAADLASWHVGILMTKMANATLFGNTASLILPLATLIAARRGPSRFEALALGAAIAGAFILMRESSDAGTARLTGDLLCVLAGVLYAGYMLAMQRARATLSPWAALGLATAAGVLPLLATAAALGENILPGNWTPLLLLSFTSQIVGQGLLIYALPHFSALVVGLTLLTQPATAALIGWLAHGEGLSGSDYLGAGLLALALVIIRMPDGRPTGGPSGAASNN